MSGELIPPPPIRGQVLDAQLHLLDRQVLDVAGEPVTAVDDIELSGLEFGDEIQPDRPPVISSFVSGRVLAARLFGGRPPDSRLARVPWENVSEVGVVIMLGIHGEQLDITWGERWLRENVIGRIPGGRHDPE
jgi:sporulation protein YlmC with PRC-barrel domain